MSALAIAVTRLMDIGAISAVVGSGIFPVATPQGQPAPYYLINLVDEPDEQMLAGAGGYYNSRIQIDCIGSSAAQANKMAELLKANFPCVKAAIQLDNESPPNTARDVDISKADTDYTDAADDRSVFRRVLDFYIRWR